MKVGVFQVIVAVVCLVSAGVPAWAQAPDSATRLLEKPQPPQSRPVTKRKYDYSPGRDCRRMGRLAYRLSLDNEQAGRLAEYLRGQRESIQPLLERVRALRQELGRELAKSTLDMDEIGQLHGQIKEAQARIADARLDAAISARKILTPEQYARFLSMSQGREAGGCGGCDMKMRTKRWHKGGGSDRAGAEVGSSRHSGGWIGDELFRGE
ncbi:MAG: periplasmic heavy metal sensor [Candidatus Omnitrophica bacterium]|nr:periplasmic heavy metal sensor [Candidatus Omnitrophota bacterium]